jgi:hypothetical protein
MKFSKFWSAFEIKRIAWCNIGIQDETKKHLCFFPKVTPNQDTNKSR